MLPVLAALVALPVAVLWGYGFQEDDFDILRRVTERGAFGMWTSAPTYFFRPLLSLTFWAQVQIWGTDPTAFRLFNSALIVAVGFSLFLLVREILSGRTFALPAAVFSAAVYVAHPSRTEAHHWVAARTDLVATCFAVLSVFAFVRFVRDGSRWALGFSLLCFALGMLSKESVVLVPLICALWGWRQLKGERNAPAVGFITVGVAYGVLRIVLAGSEIEGNLVRSTGIKLVGTTVIQVVRMVLPGVAFGDPHLTNAQAISTPAAPAFIGLGLLLIGIPFWMARRVRLPETRFLLAATILSLLPSAGLAVKLFQTQGERFLILPSVFFLPLLVALICASVRRAVPVLVAASALCVVGSTFQALAWRQGPLVAEQVAASYTAAVAREMHEEVVVLNIPARVRGSFANAHCLQAAAALKGHAVPAAWPAIQMSLERTGGSVKMSRSADRVTLLISDGHARFSQEDSEPVYARLSPTEVEVDLQKLPKGLPVYWWDGEAFHRL